MQTGPVDWKAAQFDTSDLDVFLLGCVDFDAFLLLQDRLCAEVQSRRDHYGILLICEFPPLVTIGREGSVAELPVSEDGWEYSGLPVRWVSRGGGAWRHGPGQLAISLLIPAERLGLSPACFRDQLLAAILASALELHVPAEVHAAPPGVSGRVGQFAFLGAALRSGISQFGLILNVAPHFEVLAHSPQGQRSSSLAAERLRPIGMAAVRECVIRQLAAAFAYEQFHLHTGHPWLRRTTQTVPIHA